MEISSFWREVVSALSIGYIALELQYPIQHSAINGNGIFSRRQDFSSFNALPKHKLNSYHIKIHFAQALIHKRAFTESEVREDLLLVIIIAACENNLSDGTEVAQILKISFAILDKFLKEFSSVFHHSKMSTSTVYSKYS
uniref:Headcase domain-containing protein n=1 Tax=Rhodnius prolixus TaxID=13249 RepID=T1H8T3_RHOPR